MSAELVVTYSSLGTQDGDDYYKGEECHACVKDLIRALRSDNGNCSIRRALGKASILQTDLVPLLICHHSDISLRNDVIRLLVNLTQPAILCFKDAKERKDPEFPKCYGEVVDCLHSYKEQFTETRLLNVLGSVLAELCQKDWDNRDDDDVIIIERILLLIRNILHISLDPSKEKRTDDDVSIHDQVILNLHKNGIDELLLFLGSNPSETEWSMHVLEILFLLLKEQDPKQLVQCDHRPLEEKERDERMIDEILLKESTNKSKSQSLSGSRHSRFGGSYYVYPKLPGRTRVHHKPLAGVNEYSYDREKRPLRTPINKRVAEPPPKSRKSTYSIRMMLKDFCIQVLDCCFNPMMKTVQDAIKQHLSMENDESYYLWAIRFFMEFSRLHCFRVDIVSETLQLTTFHHIINLIANYYEHLFMNKREKAEALNWSQRLHYSVNAYKELLLHIKAMTRSQDETIKDSSKVILGNILYHSDYREVCVTLIRNYKDHLQSVKFLQDVILMTHVYVELMEKYCLSTGNAVIQKKRKKKKKRSTAAHAQSGEYGEILSEEAKSSRWEELQEHVTACISEQTELTPYITHDEVSLEEQRLEAIGRIYGALCCGNCVLAVSLLRSARQIWQDDVFGSEDISTEDEIQCINDIFFSPSASIFASRQVEDDEEGEDDQQPTVEAYEHDFDFKQMTLVFTNNKIVSAYASVLSSYSTNSDEVNHAVVKMLYRVCVNHSMAPMLYHITVLNTMLSILQEPAVPRFKELQSLSKYIVSGFFKMSKTNPVIFLEVLFWKTSGECFELTEGYGTLARKKELAQNRTIFTREQEEELAELFERFKDENDIVGCIHAALPPDLGRSRKIIASQIVNQGLASSRKDLRKKPKKKKAFTEEDVYTLQSLWEPGKTSIQEIKQYFPDHTVKSIQEKLTALGLIPKKSQRRSKQNTSTSLDNDTIDSFDEEEHMTEPPHAPPGPSSQQLDSSINTSQRECSLEDISGIVEELHVSGYSSVLSWLSEYLINEAEDREIDDEWEEMCIVPQDENQSLAFNEKLFRDLLVSVGFTLPDNQIYWRIPNSIPPQGLRDIAHKLTHIQTNSPSRAASAQGQKRVHDEEAQDINRKKKPRKHFLSDDDDSGSDHQDDHENNEPIKMSKRIFNDSSSDED